MPTENQSLGEFGEQQVVKNCRCPSCKRERTLVRLPKNFKCADLICDFCGYLAQVKTASKADISVVPKQVLGSSVGTATGTDEGGNLLSAVSGSDPQRSERIRDLLPVCGLAVARDFLSLESH